MPAVTLALIGLTFLGHSALWVGIINRVHSVGIPRPVVRVLSAPCPTMFCLIPAGAIWWWWQSGMPLTDWLDQLVHNRAVLSYLMPCWTIAGITITLWMVRHGLNLGRGTVREKRSRVVDVAAELGYKPVAGLHGRLGAMVPGNQGLQIAVEQIELELPRLPPQLDGFSIGLISDLHYTGHIGIEYYKAVMREANELGADIIAVCGDIVDDVKFLEWIPETLARLSALRGVYFVLGNHDMFTHQPELVRQTLIKAGLTNLGGRWQILKSGGTEIILAGNELPWLKPAANMETCPRRTSENMQLRVLLSHSPDQLPRARRNDFDLMMAGHTHGGQFRLPIIGAIACPSWHGVKYAAGTYFEKPTTLHVSRGLAAETPLRLNCRPEVTKLVLRSAAAGNSRS